SRQVTGFSEKIRSILVVTAFKPFASTLQQRSRSVITPTSLREDWSSTTGRDPMSWSRSIIATFWAVSSGVQHTGSRVMTSRTFISASWLRLLFDNQIVHNLALPCVGLGKLQDFLVLQFVLHCPFQGDGKVVHSGLHLSVFKIGIFRQALMKQILDV